MMNDRKKGIAVRLLCVSALALAVLPALTACGSVSGQPGVKIREQTSAAAGDVTISVDVANFDLSGAGSGTRGRIVYYMDATVPTYYEHSAASRAGTYAISAETSHTWKGVAPGEHRFSVQLVRNDDSPLPLPAVDTVTLSVGAPAGSPQITGMDPADGAALPPGNILLSFGVSGFIISREDMGVINRRGEGHVIFYIDEDPPVGPGVPATTDRSAVSTDLRRMWKAVPEGQHTFSVQLVNNDDTPLDPPVVATVHVDVKAGG